jgi:hypothetical protein
MLSGRGRRFNPISEEVSDPMMTIYGEMKVRPPEAALDTGSKRWAQIKEREL